MRDIEIFHCVTDKFRIINLWQNNFNKFLSEKARCRMALNFKIPRAILAQLKLSERDYQMITQGVKIGTVRNVVTKGQPLTVSNIVNKTNMKLGGLNFSLSLSNPMYVFCMSIIASVSCTGKGVEVQKLNFKLLLRDPLKKLTLN